MHIKTSLFRTDNTSVHDWDSYRLCNCFFAIFAAIGQALFLFNFFYSIFRGPNAPQNPWRSTTLEWTTPVEHIHGNWPGDLPTVHRWPYDYSKPGASEDFISQIEPLAEGEEEH